MKSDQLDTKPAYNKYWAYKDAHKGNLINKSHYTDREITASEAMKQLMDFCYRHRGIYINFRKGFIAVKVVAVNVKDRRILQLAETEYATRGITKKETPQGIIYRIPKLS